MFTVAYLGRLIEYIDENIPINLYQIAYQLPLDL